MLPRGLLKENFLLVAFILRGLDLLAIITAGMSAFWLKFNHIPFPRQYVMALVIGALLAAVVFQLFRIYESMRIKSFWPYIWHIAQAVITIFILLAGLAFLTKTGEMFSRIWFMYWAAITLFLLIFFRCSVLLLLRVMRAHGWNERCIVIIGAGGSLGSQLIHSVQQAGWTGLRILAVFDDSPENIIPMAGITIQKIPLLADYVKAHAREIDEIWLALPLHAEDRIKNILYQLRHHTVTIRYVLDLFGLELVKHGISQFDKFAMVDLNSKPMVGINRLVKAIEDRLIAAFILVLISPLLLVIALAVKLTSPALYFLNN